MRTVFTDWLNKKIVILAGRYIWRGLLVEERGPFALLTGAHQVIQHSATAIDEEQSVGDVWINAAAIEAMYLESNAVWVK